MGETPSNTEGRSTRRSFLTAAGGAGMVALAGCTGDDTDEDPETSDGDTGDGDTGDGGTGDDDTGDDDTGDGETGDGGGEQVLQLSIPPTDSFDNIRTKGDGSTEITNQVYAGLLTHPEGGLEPVGEIATNVEISDDFQTYTFELDEDAVFHNGDPVRAQDFIYSWERLVASPNTQEARHITTDVPVEHEVEAESPSEADYPDDYVPGSLALEAVDDKTLRVDLRYAWHSTLEKLTIGEIEPIPESRVDDVPGYEGEVGFDEFQSTPVIGAGPFEFTNFDRGSSARLEAFDEYFGEGPFVDAVEMTIIDDGQARYQRALGGEADIFNVPETQYDSTAKTINREGDFGAKEGRYTLEDGTEVNYGQWQNADTRYLICNANRVPQYVRKAIAYTVNQNQLLEEAFAGLGESAYMYTPPTVFPGGPDAYYEKAEAEYPYGFDERLPGEARQLMEENGHDADNPYQITYTHHNDRQVEANAAQAALIRDQLQAVNIDMEIEQIPFGTVIDRAINGELDIFTLGNGLDYPEAQDTLRYAWPSPGNFSNWEGTPAADRAAEAWDRVENNPGPGEEETQARNEAYLDIEEAAFEDAPDIMLRHPIEVTFWRDGVDYRTPTSPFHRPQYNTVEFE